jgi:carboxypeptidase C (cathepsin A)
MPLRLAVQVCSDAINEAFPPKDVGAPMMPIYKQLVTNGSLRILVYSGDDDSICSTAGAQLWIWGMGNVVDAWRPWYSKGQVAGYTVEFPGMRFSTVHGAGHMVPSTRPQQAFDLFANFIDQRPW